MTRVLSSFVESHTTQSHAYQLEHLIIDAGQRCVGSGTAPADAQVFHAVQGESAPLTSGRCDGEEIRALHIGEVEGGAHIGSHARYLDMAHFHIAHMPQEKTKRRCHSEHPRLRILALELL